MEINKKASVAKICLLFFVVIALGMMFLGPQKEDFKEGVSPEDVEMKSQGWESVNAK